MSENIRAGKRIKEGEKGDSKCYFPCKNCCTRHPECECECEWPFPRDHGSNAVKYMQGNII